MWIKICLDIKIYTDLWVVGNDLASWCRTHEANGGQRYVSSRHVDRYMGVEKKSLKISASYVNTPRKNPHSRGTKNKSSKYIDASNYMSQPGAGLMNVVTNMKARYEPQNSDAHLPRMTEVLPL